MLRTRRSFTYISRRWVWLKMRLANINISDMIWFAFLRSNPKITYGNGKHMYTFHAELINERYLGLVAIQLQMEFAGIGNLNCDGISENVIRFSYHSFFNAVQSSILRVMHIRICNCMWRKTICSADGQRRENASGNEIFSQRNGSMWKIHFTGN